MSPCMPVGSSRLMSSSSVRTRFTTSIEFALGKTQIPMKTACSPRESNFGVIVFRTQHHVRDISQANELPILFLPHDKRLEIISVWRSVFDVQFDMVERVLWNCRPPKENYCSPAPVRTSAGLMLSAAIRSGLSQTRIAKVRPPRISARCTPLIAERRGCTIRTR